MSTSRQQAQSSVTPGHLRPFTADYHTNKARGLLKSLAARKTSLGEYYGRTLCIMLEVNLRGQQKLVTPIVVALLNESDPPDALTRDITEMKHDIGQSLKQSGMVDPTVSKMEVRWVREKSPDGVRERTEFTRENAGVMLRYLKERRGIDLIVMEWK